MLSALTDFFAFAFQAGVATNDPLRNLKYRRSALANDAQLDFMDLLLGEGLGTPTVRKLVWADFVAPLIDRRVAKIRIGRTTVSIKPATWKQLLARFRGLVAKRDLALLLRDKIAS